MLALGVGVAPTALSAYDLVGHGGPVRSLAATTDGRHVLSGSFDTRAILWERAEARQITRLHEGAVTAVTLLPDGRFASGGQDGRVAIWADDVRPVAVTQPHDMPVAALVPISGGVASAGWDGRLVLWSVGQEPRPIEAHQDQITGLASHRDGVASVGADLKLRLWSDAGAPQGSVGLPASPTAVASSGEVLFVALADGGLVRVGDDEPPVRAPVSERSLIAATAGEGLVAVSGIAGEVWLVDPETLKTRVSLQTAQGAVWSLAIADGVLLTGGNDGLIRRWTLEGVPLGDGNAWLGPTLVGGSRGAEVFRACAVCHTLTPDDGARAGPTLHGIFGRKIATAPGYDYSPALRELDIVWTPKAVSDLFKYGPEAYTPGSRMPEQRIGNAADRAALIEYLQTESR